MRGCTGVPGLGGVAVESEVAGGGVDRLSWLTLWADKKRDGHQPGSSKFRSRSRSSSVAIRGGSQTRTAQLTTSGAMYRMNSPSLLETQRLRLNIAGEFRLIANDRPGGEQGLLAGKKEWIINWKATDKKKAEIDLYRRTVWWRKILGEMRTTLTGRQPNDPGTFE